eukprot:scaffold1582_cov318-Pavlova_lutheri.AAC.4
MAITKSQATGIAPDLAKVMPLQDQSNLPQEEQTNAKKVQPSKETVKDEENPTPGEEPALREEDTDPAKTSAPDADAHKMEQKEEQNAETNLVKGQEQQPHVDEPPVQAEENADPSLSTQEGQPAPLDGKTSDAQPDESNKSDRSQLPKATNQRDEEKNNSIDPSIQGSAEQPLEKQVDAVQESDGNKLAKDPKTELEDQPALKKHKESP